MSGRPAQALAHQPRSDAPALHRGKHRHRCERQHLLAGVEPRPGEEDVPHDLPVVNRDQAQLGHVRPLGAQRVDEIRLRRLRPEGLEEDRPDGIEVLRSLGAHLEARHRLLFVLSARLAPRPGRHAIDQAHEIVAIDVMTLLRRGCGAASAMRSVNQTGVLPMMHAPSKLIQGEVNRPATSTHDADAHPDGHQANLALSGSDRDSA